MVPIYIQFNYTHIFIFSVQVLDIVMNLPIGHGLPTHVVQIVHLLCLIIMTTMIKGIWWLIYLQWALGGSTDAHHLSPLSAIC